MSRRRAVLLAAALLFITVLTARVWLRAAGAFLIREDGTAPADVVLVLAGGTHGDRLLKASDLVRAGLAPRILVSGPMEIYGVNEADLAIAFAVRRGLPAAWFEPVYIRATSTREEATQMRAVLRARGVRRLLLVTSNYHTRRSSATFRDVLGGDIDIRTVAAPDQNFSADGWWRSREGQKTFFFEAAKTVADWIGL